MNTAEDLLRSALTFRDAQPRSTELGTTFPDVPSGIADMMSVMLHEAHMAMSQPLETCPESTFLHPVDITSDEPGIVDSKEELRIRRFDSTLERMTYKVRADKPPSLPPPTYRGEGEIVRKADVSAARQEAKDDLSKALKTAEKKAATVETQAERRRQAKEERERETPEEREKRLAEARQKREENKRKKEDKVAKGKVVGKPKKRKVSEPPSEDSLAISDTSVSSVLSRPATAKRNPKNLKFYEHPLPHHRHLFALQWCSPHPSLVPALLDGTTCENLEVIQGPPGTGKTRELVRRIPSDARVFLCGPTNVSAVNLYLRCLEEGLSDEVSLVLSPDRVPKGTPVVCNDPGRRIVCATVSSRANGILANEEFDVVFLDEACQTCEAWTWTLLRKEVRHVLLAGDVKQLPAHASQSGRLLRHERSLMQRLVEDLHYDNTIELCVQNRMCPPVMDLVNGLGYGGKLSCGPHAPKEGAVRLVDVDGKEEAVGTSYKNVGEVDAIESELSAYDESRQVVVISPYLSHCKALLARKTGREVHTVDSFQGQESDVVFLSLVRDGSNGFGFWNDERRLIVALSRARRELVVFASRRAGWPVDSCLGKLFATT
jgi:hypothetical protein